VSESGQPTQDVCRRLSVEISEHEHKAKNPSDDRLSGIVQPVIEIGIRATRIPT
jgi:hypothetical protein